jgi:hypothetical protein
MADPDGYDIMGLWKDVCVSMTTSPEHLQELKNKYQLLLRFLGVAVWKKYQLFDVISKAEGAMNPEERMKRIKEGTLRNFHYEERRLLERLGEPQALKDARQKLDTIDIMLEGARKFEGVLSAYFEAMKLDLKLSFEGHE